MKFQDWFRRKPQIRLKPVPFSNLSTGQVFYEYAGDELLRYQKFELHPVTGVPLGVTYCRRCGQPIRARINASDAKNGHRHFCPGNIVYVPKEDLLEH